MDKYEYNLKLDQMKSLVAEDHYQAAAEIADTINWRKIKNVTALVRAGEIYEQVGRYGESREILLMAYDRSPIGRAIVYRLACVAIKMEKYDEAKEYYKEFVEIAPHDNLKYVLKYEINKAEGADYQTQISILELIPIRTAPSSTTSASTSMIWLLPAVRSRPIPSRRWLRRSACRWRTL